LLENSVFNILFAQIKFITVTVRNDHLNDQFIKCANKERLKQEKIK